MPAPKKAYKGLPMEGIIATWYDRNAGRGRGFDRMAATVVSRLPPGGSVLEVAPGPGYLAIEIGKLGVERVAGLDISRSFVRIAGENARRAGVKLDVAHGDAAHMPYAGESFDYVVCSAAFKNFTDPVGALVEMHRVLRPGGQASIFDLRRDASLEDIDAEVDRMQLSWASAAFTRLSFRYLLLRNAYTLEQMEDMARRSRFGGGRLSTEGIGFELRLAK